MRGALAIDGDCPVQHSPRAGTSRVVFWRGRIDNVRELQARHSQCDDVDSDSPALIVAAYERDGIVGLRQVLGDWCTVILDKRRGAVVLASDYSGTKPLYYCRRGDRVLWSTRIETVTHGAGCTDLDEDYVAHYLAHGGHERKTVWAGVQVVPPGCAVVITAAGETTAPFWTAPVHERTVCTEADYEARFRDLFTESVAARLQEPNTAIVELSGGLDSSAVACVATRLVRTGLVPARDVVTVSYVHPESTDVSFLRHVRSELGVRGIELSTEKYPLATAQVSATPTESWGALYSAVATIADDLETRTILTGQGGDLVAGNFWDDSLQVAAALRRGRLAAAVRESTAWSRRTWRPAVTILAEAARVAFCPGGGRRLIERRTSPSGETSLSRALNCRATATNQSLFGEWIEAPPERRAHFRQLSSMRRLRSLRPAEPLRDFEYSHPFAHRPLLEFLMTVPAHVLCGPGEPRLLMRKAFTGILQERVRQRRSKSLFGLPWIRSLRPLAIALLSAPSLMVVDRGWVDADSLKRRLRRLVHGLDCNESQLRRIIMLECWLSRADSPDCGARSALHHVNAPQLQGVPL